MWFRIVRFFQTPHPFIFNVQSIVIPGAVSFLLIVMIAPFGFQELPLMHRVAFALLFGTVGSCSVWAVVSGLRKTAASFMQEEEWTVGKEFLLILLVVATISLVNATVFLGFDLAEHVPMLPLFFQVVFQTVAISVFPVAILILFEQYTHQKQKFQQARQLTEQLRQTHLPNVTSETPKPQQSEEPVTPFPERVVFTAENGKPVVQVSYRDIAFLKSDGNYVEVFYQETPDKLGKSLVRNRLKVCLELLPPALFFHCHKSYVVSGAFITEVKGNARNFELKLKGHNITIPVSRSRAEALKAFLQR